VSGSGFKVRKLGWVQLGRFACPKSLDRDISTHFGGAVLLFGCCKKGPGAIIKMPAAKETTVRGHPNAVASSGPNMDFDLLFGVWRVFGDPF